jgi:hypothetical protein
LADVLFGKYKQPILHTTDEEDDAFVEQRWTDLRKGDTELPFQVPEDFLGKSIWLGKKDGGKIGERVRIKEIAHDATLLAEPLKNDFLKPVEVIYGAPSTAEQTVIELLKSYRCKTC